MGEANEHAQARLAKALAVLEAEIDRREEVLDTLKDAAGAMRELLTGSSDDLMDKADVIAFLGVSRTAVDRYIAGRVPSHKPPFPAPHQTRGKKLFYRRSAILSWKETYLTEKHHAT